MEFEIKEKIKVVSVFENGKLRPFIFVWKKRVYKILRVIFSYSKDIGKDRIFYFSVQCEGGPACRQAGYFEISFNREKFSWNIEKIFNS